MEDKVKIEQTTNFVTTISCTFDVSKLNIAFDDKHNVNKVEVTLTQP